MGADVRMAETKAAILSLLIDAYQKRERVGLIVFRGREARLSLCPSPTAWRWPSATWRTCPPAARPPCPTP